MPQEATPVRPPVDDTVSGGVAAAVSNISGGQIAVGDKVIQISAEHGSVVVAGDTQPLQVVRRPPPIDRGLRAPRTLIGRQSELQRIHALLDEGRSVELVGPPGIGKTTVLGALGTLPLPQAAPDGVVAPPAGLPVEDALQFVFDACLERNQRVQPTPEEVLRHLRDLRLLLLVDDTELGRGDVERLVAALPNSVFVISCNEALLVGGDVPLTLHALGTADAVELLASALGRPVGPDEADAAVRLTEGLDGVPLEILQLAAVVAGPGLSLNTLAYDIAPTIPDPRAALHSATVDTLDARQHGVLVALAAFGGVAVGIGLLAKYAAEPEAVVIVRRLVERGLARGDDLVGWAPVDPAAAGEEDRARSAAAVVAWVCEVGRDPREVANEAPAILSVARQDLEAGRHESVIRLAGATEGMLALAGNWGAWKSILKSGVMAARAVSDRTSEAFFGHQLEVRADMLRPRTLAEEHLAEAMQEPDSLYREAATHGEETRAGRRVAGHAQGDGPAAGGLPGWVKPLGIGLVAATVLTVIVLVWQGGGGGGGAAVAIAARELPADRAGPVRVIVTAAEPNSVVEIRFADAASVKTQRGDCNGAGGVLRCELTGSGDEDVILATVKPDRRTAAVTVTATVFQAGAQAATQTERIAVAAGTQGNQGPTAKFRGDSQGLTLRVDASGSSDPDGEVRGFDWDFGDGQSGSGRVTDHTYSEAGTFTVTLTVTDDDGATDTAAGNATVAALATTRPPRATFAFDVQGLTLLLDASGSSDPDGEVRGFDWDFGDGEAGSGRVTDHTYSEAGTFTVTLTVTDDDGATDTAAGQVTVSATPPTDPPPPPTAEEPTPTPTPPEPATDQNAR